MVNHDAALDPLFHVLADPTRRAVVARLARSGPATVGDLASPFAMGLPAFLKHVRLLEENGLVVSTKSGRSRICTIRPDQIARAADWLDDLRRHAEARVDRFAAYVESLEPPKGDKN